MTHLAALASEVESASGDLEAVRRVIDQYSNVDPVVLDCPAACTEVEIARVSCEWLCDSASSPCHRLMYVHGGSWISGTLAGYRAHAGRLARVTGCSVLNVGYRLAPENPFPAGLDDCDRVLDWMIRNGPRGNCGEGGTLIAGDSAGGNLILALLIRRRDQGKPLPDAAVALSPATDLTWSGRSLTERVELDPVIRPSRLDGVVRAYLQGHAVVDDPYVSPLFANLEGLPPLLLQVGEAEVLLDDSVRLVEKALAAGVPARLDCWAGMPHVFQMFAPYLPQAGDALEVIGKFVSAVLENSH